MDKKTNAQRQKEYRQRRKNRHDKVKLSLYIDADQAHKLACLTKHHKLTKSAMLGLIIDQANERVVKAMAPDEFNVYNDPNGLFNESVTP